jgi:hypothetical protein
VLSDVFDVLVALRIAAFDRVFRWANKELYIRAEFSHQAIEYALSIVGAIREEALHIYVYFCQ